MRPLRNVPVVMMTAYFDMRAKGMLQPVKRIDIFAPSGGVVRVALKDSGDEVAAGETVAVIDNPDLTMKKTLAEGEFKAANEEILSLSVQLQSTKRMTDVEKKKLEGQRSAAQLKARYKKQALDLISKREEELTIKSPMAGRVITWDVKKALQNRPVETGQVLMTIAANDSDYEVEMYMPERRIEHLRRYRDKLKQKNASADLEVEFISMTDPGVSHHGHVVHVNPTAEPHDEHGNMVRIRVQPDTQLTNPRPGATVTADVHCGRAPWLWAKLHEAWEWVEANVLF
jgi:multidrug efflux pump subunit AcrA (membrane-fusion protein)